jgi:hypothetical protein
LARNRTLTGTATPWSLISMGSSSPAVTFPSPHGADYVDHYLSRQANQAYSLSATSATGRSNALPVPWAKVRYA